MTEAEVPPRTDLEFLRSLLEGAQETAVLDFKDDYDPRSRAARAELAKDLGAMLSTDGGHVVLGIEDASAQPTGSLDGYDARAFDSAALQGVFLRWLPAPFDLRSAVHTIDEHTVVVLYIAPPPDVFAPFLVAGAYEAEGE